MATHYQVTHSAHIAAPPQRIYDILSDYHVGHPSILPPQFRNLVVEQGGRGAGTLTRFEVRAFGRTETIHHEVFEPEPGRVLMEKDRDTGATTRFVVEPSDGGADVTIASDLPKKPGIAGRLEAWLTKRFLLGLYKVELAKLDAAARQP